MMRLPLIGQEERVNSTLRLEGVPFKIGTAWQIKNVPKIMGFKKSINLYESLSFFRCSSEMRLNWFYRRVFDQRLKGS